MTRRLLAALLLQTAVATAYACRFAQDAQPAQWHEWSSALFAAEVTRVGFDADESQDVITVRVIETYKGPEGSAATLRVPSRMWSSCRLTRPQAGERVLVALNPSGDTLLLPLTESYRERLRRHPPTPAAK